MPVERRGRSPTLGVSQLATGGAPILDGRRQPSCGGTSRMTRECQVRICEGLGVKFPGPTRQNPNLPHRNTDARFTSISRPQQGGFNATICADIVAKAPNCPALIFPL